MQIESRIKIPPISGLFIGILAVSTASIFIRLAQGTMPSFVIAAGRLTIAAIVLAPFALSRNWSQLIKIDRRTWFFLSLAGLFLGLHFAAWITSLEYTTVASSVVLVTTAPLWVALLSPLFLKEKISKWVFIGLCLSLSGSIVVGSSTACIISRAGINCLGFSEMFSGRYFVGNLMALTGAFLSAGYIMAGRRVRSNLNLSLYAFIVYGIAAVVLVILVVLSGEPVTGYANIDYFYLVALALIPQLIGHSFFNWALKYLSAAYVSIALLGEPVGTVILAYLFLHERPLTLEILGGVLILAGIGVASRTSRKVKGDNPSSFIENRDNLVP